MTAAANGSGRLDEQRGEALDARRGPARSPAAAPPDRGRCRGTGRCRSPRSGRRGARGRSAVTSGDAAVSGAIGRRRPSLGDGSTVGGGVAGSWSAGMNQSGRDAGSRPETSVRSIVSPTVQAGAVPSSLARRRSTVWPSRWRNAMPSPAGDQVGAHDAPSVGDAQELLRRSMPSRMTTSVPKADVRVAATYAPVGRVGRVRGSRARSEPAPSPVSTVVAHDHRRPARAVAAVPDVEQELAVGPPLRILVTEHAVRSQAGIGQLLGRAVEELEDDVLSSGSGASLTGRPSRRPARRPAGGSSTA